MKKVLAFIDWYVPGNKAGGPVQSQFQLAEFMRGSLHWRIVTRHNDYCSTDAYTDVAPNTWQRLSEAQEVLYLPQSELDGARIKSLIDSDDSDTIYVNGIYSRFFSILPAWYALSAGKRVIVAPRGMLSPQAIMVKTLRKLLFLNTVRWLPTARRIVFQATNTAEKAHIASFFPKNSIRLAPNIARAFPTPETQWPDKQQGQLRLIMLGRVAPEKNTLYAINALSSLPYMPQSQITMDIYGTIYDTQYWQTCEQAIALLPPNIRVQHAGNLPQHAVIDTLRQYHALFMPSLGENFGHSIAESLMAGRPVMVSTATPWNNLADENAGWVLNLNDIQQYVNVLIQLIEMPWTEWQPYCVAARICAHNRLNAAENRKAYTELFDL